MYERLFSCLIVLILLLFPISAFAGNIDPDNDGSKYAWGENVGWINFEPSQCPGVTVDANGLTGYAWGENIGWINLSCLNTGNCATVNYGVANDGKGNLSGYAWGENVGWINFLGVFIHPVTGIFSGYAWGENIGWINFAPGGIGIKTSWLNPQACTDNDADGYAVEGGSCGSLDCNDGDPLEHPNQTWYKDKDNDGYSNGNTIVQCVRPVNSKVASELTDPSVDCNDKDAAIHPGAVEICDTVDNNCDGQIDEGLTSTYYQDADEDSYGDPANSIQACTLPSGYVTDNTDCDDNDSAEHPNQTWYKDKDNDGFSDGTQNTASCTRPTGYKIVSELTATSGDCNDMNPTINIAQGICGVIDPEDNDSQYAWGENVGWINLKPSQGPGVNVTDTVVTGYAWGENIGWINLHPANHGGVTNDGAGNLSGYAWGENVGWINFNPTGGGIKIDSLTGVFSGKAWGENIGWINFAPNRKPVKTSWKGAVDADGDGYNSTVDCDDGNPDVHPGADDSVCDGVDNNCNGQIDEGYTPTQTTCGVGACASTGLTTCSEGVEGNTCTPGTPTAEVCDGLDNDCNGSVDDNLTRPTTCGIGACASTGTETCTAGTWGNDTCTSSSPTAETCNNIDDNCDGSVDENLGTTTCGVGACQRTVDNCVNGVVQTCTPGTPTAEICDGLDNDCDSVIDEDLGTTTCGVGACQVTVANCVGGTPQVCAPLLPTAEVCDGVDNDCNGSVDEGVMTVFYQDADGDGYGNSSSSIQSCTQPAGYVTNNTDCNDSNLAINPGATEVCNSVDDNCDANIDEGDVCPVTYTFYGFFSPVDNPPNLNKANSGQTVPVKWRITDANGVPISDSMSFKSLKSYIVNCDNYLGSPTDAIEEYSAGSSGLQYPGDGNWQFNWKTPKTYAGQCRTMVLTLGDESTHTANFKFK